MLTDNRDKLDTLTKMLLDKKTVVEPTLEMLSSS